MFRIPGAGRIAVCRCLSIPLAVIAVKLRLIIIGAVARYNKEIQPIPRRGLLHLRKSRFHLSRKFSGGIIPRQRIALVGNQNPVYICHAVYNADLPPTGSDFRIGIPLQPFAGTIQIVPILPVMQIAGTHFSGAIAEIPFSMIQQPTRLHRAGRREIIPSLLPEPPGFHVAPRSH